MTIIALKEPEKCNEYTTCVDGNPTPGKCSTGVVWSPTILACTTPAQVGLRLVGFSNTLAFQVRWGPCLAFVLHHLCPSNICISCDSPFLFSPRDQSARQQWSESSPVPKPASGANFEDLGVLQSSINSGSATTTGWPTPRTVASSTCALRTGPSTRRRATNPWPLTSLPGRANLRRRCLALI